MQGKPALQKLIRTLGVCIFLVAFYFITAPYVPNVAFWLNPPVVAEVPAPAPAKNGVYENKVIIPKLGLSEAIYEGANDDTLDKGVWHRPHTATPNSGSNTVLVGHRTTYTTPQGVFYHLDKMQAGDEIVVQWRNTNYTYRVTNILEVTPDQVQIEAPTSEGLLTLYTCTPLWSNHLRLVVQAKPL